MNLYLENKFVFGELSQKLLEEKLVLSHKLMHLRAWKLPVLQVGAWGSQKALVMCAKLLPKLKFENSLGVGSVEVDSNFIFKCPHNFIICKLCHVCVYWEPAGSTKVRWREEVKEQKWNWMGKAAEEVWTRSWTDPESGESAGVRKTELEGGNQPGREPETEYWDCLEEETKVVTLPGKLHLCLCHCPCHELNIQYVGLWPAPGSNGF